jgi:hypothetical protein
MTIWGKNLLDTSRIWSQFKELKLKWRGVWVGWFKGKFYRCLERWTQCQRTVNSANELRYVFQIKTLLYLWKLQDMKNRKIRKLTQGNIAHHSYRSALIKFRIFGSLVSIIYISWVWLCCCMCKVLLLVGVYRLLIVLVLYRGKFFV